MDEADYIKTRTVEEFISWIDQININRQGTEQSNAYRDRKGLKMIEGESRFVLKLDCQLSLNTVASTLTFSCPNTNKTWVYKGY